MGCRDCRFYEFDGFYRCTWFESRISRVFPGWKDNFRRGEIRFKKCGYYGSRRI